MKFYRLEYQHHKDIVDDNVLTVFVVAKNEEQVENFAKKCHYAVEKIVPLTEKEFEIEKEMNEHFRMEHADQYV